MGYNIFVIIYFLGTLAGLWLVFRKTQPAARRWNAMDEDEKLKAMTATGTYNQEKAKKHIEHKYAEVAPWVSLVPLYNIVKWIRIVGKPWSWYIYCLIPGINIFIFLLLVSETARVFRRNNFLEMFLAILFPFVYLPWLGWSRHEYHDPCLEPPAKISEKRDWGEAVVFALVAAVLIRAFVFELFSIPSSSMEKSLLVGDHLMVSKMAYGPRAIMTPLSLPLVHNSLGGASKSYIEWPHLPYHRFPGFGKVKRFDAVVFNFPCGDTIVSSYPGCQRTYYEAVRTSGREAVLAGNGYFITGKDRYGNELHEPAGKVLTRPLDKREHYIKRCIGLPGEDLQIIDRVVYINGKPVEQPQDVQFMYTVTFAAGFNPERVLDECGVSRDDINFMNGGYDGYTPTVVMVPLSNAAAAELASKSITLSVEAVMDAPHAPADLFPNVPDIDWTVDNYGPVHIPAKGEVLKLTMDNLPFYRRVVTAYEHNTLEVRNGLIFINGQQTDSYTVKQDYYWMMGDNRHCSQDSRYWGFVPEDHIAGKAVLILWSWDKDHKRVRWNRTLMNTKSKDLPIKPITPIKPISPINPI
jgi:signal peptidase I